MGHLPSNVSFGLLIWSFPNDNTMVDVCTQQERFYFPSFIFCARAGNERYLSLVPQTRTWSRERKKRKEAGKRNRDFGLRGTRNQKREAQRTRKKKQSLALRQRFYSAKTWNNRAFSLPSNGDKFRFSSSCFCVIRAETRFDSAYRRRSLAVLKKLAVFVRKGRTYE